MKMSTTHFGLLAIVLIAGIWLFMQNGSVEAQPTTISNVILPVPTIAPAPASGLANALAMLKSGVSAAANPAVPASAELSAISPAVISVAAPNHETGIVFREKTIVNAEGKGLTVSAWDANGLMVGTVEHPIRCEWVADGWNYTGPAEHLPFATQSSIVIPALRDLCSLNGAY
jgi:hypothetical protein